MTVTNAAARAYQPGAPVLKLRYLARFAEICIGKNGETPHNDQIIGFSPAEEGASPWSWSPMRFPVSRGGSARWD
jgi:hypothetical protein